MITLSMAVELLNTTKPTANKAIHTMVDAGVLSETIGLQRDRIDSYRAYLDVLTEDTQVIKE